MDRLVMRYPVPKEVETLHPIFHLDLDRSRFANRWVKRKRGRYCGHPQ